MGNRSHKEKVVHIDDPSIPRVWLNRAGLHDGFFVDGFVNKVEVKREQFHPSLKPHYTMYIDVARRRPVVVFWDADGDGCKEEAERFKTAYAFEIARIEKEKVREKEESKNVE